VKRESLGRDVDQPLPAALVTMIVQMRMEENEATHPKLS
jgi:hypothetical protein